MQNRVQFLGVIIDVEGQHASNEKIEAVLKAPCPHDVKQLRSFLGMMNYYRKFIPDLATILKPLTALLQHRVKWAWNSVCDKAFQEAKQLLIAAPVLVHYDPAFTNENGC